MDYKQIANNLKFLAVDMVNAANSGHPGVAMGLADALAVLASKLRFDPARPQWANRDRLIFSGGHASSLIYSFLHLAGYELGLDELRNFRQLGARTSGHPEIAVAGVEIDTGPLGQGVANAVGMALAAKHAARSCGALNHRVFCFCGDGDLQEGISYEACSLARVHNLDNLVLLYDSNGISIEGNVANAFADGIFERFASCGFKVFECDGHDHAAISAAIDAACAAAPAVVLLRTKIGAGALELEGSEKTHGAPLGAELAARAKAAAGWSSEEFFVSEQVRASFAALAAANAKIASDWEAALSPAEREFLASLDNRRAVVPDFSALLASAQAARAEGKKIATRASNHSCLQAIAAACSSFIGGSADLAPSNKTELAGEALLQNGGRQIAFGIREHAMGAVCNAFARYGYLPFCATFLVFSDYLKPAVRLAALMKLREFFIFTHDCIGVGEDGPTHQPIEQIAALRALPNLLTLRPADALENAACWQLALAHEGPSAFVLSRSGLAVLHEQLPDLSAGAVCVRECETPEITLVASGSEVDLALKAAEILAGGGTSARVLSMPCYELFVRDAAAQKRLLAGRVIAVEAASGDELYRFADAVYGMQSFGASGKEAEVFAHFGFTPERLAAFCREQL